MFVALVRAAMKYAGLGDPEAPFLPNAAEPAGRPNETATAPD